MIEIGPGTGQATRSLAATGASITAVELGTAAGRRPAAERPRTDVEVVNSAFEDWIPAAAGRPRDVVHGLALGRPRHPGGSGRRRARSRRPAGDGGDRSRPRRHGGVLRAGPRLLSALGSERPTRRSRSSLRRSCRRSPTRSTPIRGSPRPSAGATSATSPTPPTTTWPCCETYSGHRALSPERRTRTARLPACPDRGPVRRRDHQDLPARAAGRPGLPSLTCPGSAEKACRTSALAASVINRSRLEPSIRSTSMINATRSGFTRGCR